MSQDNNNDAASFSDYIKSALIYPLPHHAISRLVLKLTRIRGRWAQPVIRWFIKTYQVNMSEAANSETSSYPSFNEFFTRELKAGARPWEDQSRSLICPVDGAVSQIGRIEKGLVLQAKGHGYQLAELLASETAAKDYEQGGFATLYLSPRDYHRIHMPIDGELTRMTYVPGRLFSVAAHTVRVIPRLFARNERLVCYFDTPAGKIVMVLVGAINVAAIETVWEGLVTPPRKSGVKHSDYTKGQIKLNKGEEMGRFNMGSTVIVITQKNATWQPKLAAEQAVQLGQDLASF